jgi:Ca2+-binding RTX toxin-like protein
LPVEFSTKGDDYLLAGELNANLYGADGDDTIIGSEGQDTLGGGPGDDVLDGGPGKDMLYGHEGKDRFVISEGEGKDEIHFFEQGLDVIQIKHAGGKLALAETEDGYSVSLDGNQIALMKNVELDFGLCTNKLAVIDNQFIA